jgi:outer membrane biosynthesis protein TonB
MTTTRVAEREKTRRRTWWALVISLLVHLTVILAVAWIYFLEVEPPPEPVEEIEITIVQPPPAPPKPAFVDTSAPEAEKPPENAPFESDRDTAAASPDAATGAEPLPSQEGREQPVLELENQELALAEVKDTPPAPEAPPAQPALPQPPQPEETKQAKREEEKPEKADAEALLAAAQTKPQEKQREEPKPPPAQPPAKPSFQRQARPTRLSGSVSNRGRSAVASMATPLGRYRKQITDAIGSSWYHHIGPRMDIFSYGTVSVVFVIDRNGKARRPRVVSNTSNESFEIVTVESILAADIPPIPPEIVPTLEGGQIEMDYTFSIITN